MLDNDPEKKKLMRDVVIDQIYNAATTDRNIVFISADFGAQSLDKFRNELPDQFIHAGISEQNMVDLSSGLSISGKQVFLYAMAPFITARCYEQIKCSLSAMNLPVTLIGVGVGLGYDHSTLTHFTPEDIACMRALNGIEILSPSDQKSAEVIAANAVTNPAFRYLRLERNAHDQIYNDEFIKCLDTGFYEISRGDRVAIVSYGALLHKVIAARDELKKAGLEVGVIDLYRVKRISVQKLFEYLSSYKSLLTVEEHILDGGFGGAVLEALADSGLQMKVKRLGLSDGFAVVNGDRDQLHKLYGVDTGDIVSAVMELEKH